MKRLICVILLFSVMTVAGCSNGGSDSSNPVNPVNPVIVDPVDPTPDPVDPTPDPVDPTPDPVDPTPDPVDPTPDPVDPTPDPVDPTPDPVDPTPDPVDPTPDPVDPTPDPVDPTPDPVDPTPDPVDPTPDPVETKKVINVKEDSIAINITLDKEPIYDIEYNVVTISNEVDEVKCISKNEDVIEVISNSNNICRVKGLKAGNGEVSLSLSDEEKSEKIVKVDVKKEDTGVFVEVASVKLDWVNRKDLDETHQIKAKFLPERLSQEFEYKSLKEKVATVDDNGLVTPTGVGETEIIVKSKNYDFSTSVKVTVWSSKVKKIVLKEECELANRGYGINIPDYGTFDAKECIARVEPAEAMKHIRFRFRGEVLERDSFIIDQYTGVVTNRGSEENTGNNLNKVAYRIQYVDITNSFDDDVSRPRSLKDLWIHGRNKSVVIDEKTNARFYLDGSNVYAWGDNTDNVLGLGSEYAKVDKPTLIKNLPERIVRIETAEHTTYAVGISGRLYVWGSNRNHQAGTEENVGGVIEKPVLISLPYRIGNIVTLGHDTIATDHKTNLTAWGSNKEGFEKLYTRQVKSETPHIPVTLDFGLGFGAISVDKENDRFWMGLTGRYNGWDVVGKGAAKDCSDGLGAIANIVGTRPYMYFIDGTTYFVANRSSAGIMAYVGDNTKGIVTGLGEETDKLELKKYTGVFSLRASVFVPEKETGYHSVKTVIGDKDNRFIVYNNKLYGWGANQYGQLGNGAKNDEIDKIAKEISPEVFKEKLIETAVLDKGSMFAITTDGELYAWGNNKDGILGLSSGETEITTPQKVVVYNNGEIVKFYQVFVSNGSFYAVTADGDLYSWGTNNSNGELGLGNTDKILVPTKVELIK